MTSSETVGMQFEILRQVKGTTAKKEELRGMDSAMLRRVLVYTYDASITFGISPDVVAQWKPPYNAEDRNFDQDTFDLLESLGSRKISGNAAKVAINEQLANLNPYSQEVFLDILGGNHHIGMQAISINSVFPGLIRIEPYMRSCSEKEAKLSTWDWSQGVYSQLKADGMYVSIKVLEHVDKICSREGRDISEHLEELLVIARSTLPDGFAYHGELQVVRQGKLLDRQTGNGIINSITQGGEYPDDVCVVVSLWDMVSLAADDDPRPYSERFEDLRALGIGYDPSRALHIIETMMVYSEEEANRHFQQVRKKGLEGTIIKHASCPWRSGTPRLQVKKKGVMDNTMRITGFTEGHVGLYKGLVGALCVSSDDGKVVCNVSGFPMELRRQFTDDRELYIGALVDVAHNGLITAKATAHKVSSLQNPRFVKLRNDKSEADLIGRFI